MNRRFIVFTATGYELPLVEVCVMKHTIVCRIVFITGKSVKLPNDYNLKLFAGTVFIHPLKIGTAVGSCRQRTVDVGFNDLNIIFLGKSLAFAKLSFNRFFTLIIGRD